MANFVMGFRSLVPFGKCNKKNGNTTAAKVNTGISPNVVSETKVEVFAISSSAL